MSFWDGSNWVADTPPEPKRPSRVKRLAAATLEAALITALTFGLIAGSAFAAKGGNRASGSGTLTGPVMVRDADTDGAVSHGDDITFNVSTASDRPFVGLRCWQGPNWVYDGYVGYFDSAMFDPWFSLGSPYWDPAAEATCTARLFSYNKRGGESLLATPLNFVVQP